MPSARRRHPYDRLLAAIAEPSPQQFDPTQPWVGRSSAGRLYVPKSPYARMGHARVVANLLAIELMEPDLAHDPVYQEDWKDGVIRAVDATNGWLMGSVPIAEVCGSMHRLRERLPHPARHPPFAERDAMPQIAAWLVSEKRNPCSLPRHRREEWWALVHRRIAMRDLGAVFATVDVDDLFDTLIRGWKFLPEYGYGADIRRTAMLVLTWNLSEDVVERVLDTWVRSRIGPSEWVPVSVIDSLLARRDSRLDDEMASSPTPGVRCIAAHMAGRRDEEALSTMARLSADANARVRQTALAEFRRAARFQRYAVPVS